MAEPSKLVSLDRIFTGKERPSVTARRVTIDYDGTVLLTSLFGGYLDPCKRRTLRFEKDEIVHRYVKSGASLNWVRGVWLSGVIEWDKIGWDTAELLIQMYRFEMTKLGATGEGDELILKIHNDDPVGIAITLDGGLEFPYLADKLVGHSASISWRGMLRMPYTDIDGTIIDIEDLFTDLYLEW